MGEHRLDARTGRIRHHEVHHTAGDTGAVEQFDEIQGGERRLRRRFEYDGATGCERRTDLAGEHGGRKVPRRQQQGDTDGLAGNGDPIGACGRAPQIAIEAYRLLGEPTEELGGVGDFAAGVGERLAVFANDQGGDRFGFGDHQVEGPSEDLRTRPRRSLSPRRERLGRRVDGTKARRHVGARDLGDQLSVAGVFNAEAVGPLDPLAADPTLGGGLVDRHGRSHYRARVHARAGSGRKGPRHWERGCPNR